MMEIVIIFILSVWAGKVAEAKGRSFFNWFIITLFLSIFGVALAYLVESKKPNLPTK